MNNNAIKISFITILLFLLISTTNAEEHTRCFVSTNLKRPIYLQCTFDFNKKSGRVSYKNGSGSLPIRQLTSEELMRNEGRPSLFEYVWVEEIDGKENGRYIFEIQGANFYSFRYVKSSSGFTVSFKEYPKALSDSMCECEWK